MQTAQRRVGTPIYNVVNGLAADTCLPGQLSITHVFFIITLRRFNCDSYFFSCFILFVIVKMVIKKDEVAVDVHPVVVVRCPSRLPLRLTRRLIVHPLYRLNTTASTREPHMAVPLRRHALQYTAEQHQIERLVAVLLLPVQDFLFRHIVFSFAFTGRFSCGPSLITSSTPYFQRDEEVKR